MEKINGIIEYLNHIKENRLMDILIAIAIFLVFKILSSFIAYLVIKIFNMKVKDKKKIKENALYKPIQAFITILGIYMAILFLSLPENIMIIVNKIFRISIIIIIANGIGNLLSPKSRLIKKIKNSDKINANDKVTEFVGKTIRTVIYVIAGFIISEELGYNLSGVIAGLGIGSVVLALAAQDIAKNICSGIVLLFDKPFTIGDFITIGQIEGHVEDITFRAVRIRTREDKMVTIPNSKVSEDIITNYSKINTRRYYLDLLVTLETDVARIYDIMEKIKELLRKNPYTLDETVEVHFDQILDNGMNIKIFCFTKTSEYIEFLNIEENINMQIMELVKKEKINLAYDTKTVYINK